MKRVAKISPKLLASVATLLLVLGCDGNTPTAPVARPQPPAAPTAVVGTVYAHSGTCLPGAVVEVLDGVRAGEKFTQKECDGYWDDGPPGYSIVLPAGQVRMRASMPGYRTKEETFTATTVQTNGSNFFLDPQ